jgi:hypothetical protein
MCVRNNKNIILLFLIHDTLSKPQTENSTKKELFIGYQADCHLTKANDNKILI